MSRSVQAGFPYGSSKRAPWGRAESSNFGGQPGYGSELKFTQGGTGRVAIRLATTESYMNKGGERQERTEWHTAVVVLGQARRVAQQDPLQGRTIWVEGRIQTRAGRTKKTVAALRD